MGGIKSISNDVWFQENVNINFSGSFELIPQELRVALKQIQGTRKNLFNKYRLKILIGYDGQDQIIEAINSYANNFFDSGDILTKESFNKLFMHFDDFPEIDLIIRTGMSDGQRLSGFCLWDAAYAELIFRKELWPDYDVKLLMEDLEEYEKRNRRRGK